MSAPLDLAPLGLAASILTNVVQFFAGRRRAAAETNKVRAEAELADMQAADLLIKNLTAQYTAAVAAQEQMRNELASMREEISGLRDEVSDLNARFEEIAKIVRGLPEHIQHQFAEALRPRPRRTAAKHLPE